MPLPRLSIVIPSLNGTRTLGHALRSLQAQTERNFETIVVDDGSTDGTAALAGSFPGVIVVSHATPLGVSVSRNDGVARSSSPWICFLDDDDWFPATFVEQALARVEPGVALCYDNVIVSAEGGDEDRAVVGESILATSTFRRARIDRSSLDRCFDGLPMLKSIVERTAFDRVRGFDARYFVGEDFQFHIKLVAAGYVLQLSDEPCAFYRRRADSVTARTLRRGIGLRIAAAHRWIRMATDMLAELDLTPPARAALRQDLLDGWRYRLATAMIRAFAEGNASPFDWKLLGHVPGALTYAMMTRRPRETGIRLPSVAVEGAPAELRTA